MTFLEICQQLGREVNAGGSLPTVVGQTGLFQKIVEFVQRADYNIQTSYTNWDFLQKEWGLSLVADLASYAAPTDLKAFDETSFWSAAGTDEAQPITYVPYKEWRDNYRHDSSTGECSIVSVKPDKTVVFSPVPDSTYSITADYFKRPIELSYDTQTSDIPEAFHNVIKALAKVYFAENRHDNGWYQTALIEYNDLIKRLKATSLPGWYDEDKSESSVLPVIRVM